MGKRVLWLWLLPLGFGCTVLTPPASPPPKPQAAEVVDPLQLAAECLERGDDAAALPLLTRYVEAHPDHPAIRVHLADVMFRLGQHSAARHEFEQAIADGQEQSENRYLIHAHTRLVDIATADGDEFRERLHRGIALFLLAKQVRTKAEDDAPDPEQLLFKAAAELKTAGRLRPDSTQAHWYSYEVWTHLGQTLPARTSLRRARDCSAISDLTAAEREEMATACEGEFAVMR
jgi:hypothetical protein